LKKFEILNLIDAELERRGTHQGSKSKTDETQKSNGQK